MHRDVHYTLPAAVLVLMWIAKDIVLRTRNVVQFLVLIVGGARPTIKEQKLKAFRREGLSARINSYWVYEHVRERISSHSAQRAVSLNGLRARSVWDATPLGTHRFCRYVSGIAIAEQTSRATKPLLLSLSALPQLMASTWTRSRSNQCSLTQVGLRS